MDQSCWLVNETRVFDELTDRRTYGRTSNQCCLTWVLIYSCGSLSSVTDWDERTGSRDIQTKDWARESISKYKVSLCEPPHLSLCNHMGYHVKVWTAARKCYCFFLYLCGSYVWHNRSTNVMLNDKILGFGQSTLRLLKKLNDVWIICVTLVLRHGKL